MPILKPGINCSGIHDVDATGLLVDSCDYYRAFYDAARHARHYLLLAGWQFDTDVCLLRGKEAVRAPGDVRLLPFLEHLCRVNPALEVYILAWDFSVIFSLEREWFQNLIFNWSSNERIHFLFDNHHAAGAGHHQKFVIVDGKIAFIGGIDICSDRWDDRRHMRDNPERKNLDGIPYGPYHDIQSYHIGPVVREVVDLFVRRWADAGGDPLVLPEAENDIPFRRTKALPVAACRVALSLTQAKYLPRYPEPVLEIRRLYLDAIAAAEHLIYMENQYLSSQAVYSALVNRMSEEGRPRPRIIIVLPDRLPFTEELFLGVPQMKMIRSLKEVALQTGTELGVYSTACLDGGERKMTFIHSKLLMVDDRFLTVGSANATNRSMSLDTELNVSWEAEPRDRRLVRSLKRIRASLLAEHAGIFDHAAIRRLEESEGLVECLEKIADDPGNRLCRYLPESSLENGPITAALQPVGRVVDPEKPLGEEFMFEYMSDKETSLFTRGILLLSQWIAM